MKRSKKIFFIALLALIGLALGAGYKIYTVSNIRSAELLEELEKKITPGSAQYEELKEQGRFNILIVGEDNIESSRRSDTILFVTVDVTGRSIRVLSIPRDTRVEIPGHSVQKLNHAFAYGGSDLLKATIERYLGQPILYYIVVDYDSFPAVVDTIGGVEIDVKKKMHYVDKAGNLNIDIKPGPQLMNGEQALHFVRFRMDALGDIGRINRQQQFLKAFLKKIYDPRIIVKIPELTNNLLNLFKTDMMPAFMVQLAGFVQNELGRERIFFSTLNGQAAIIDKLSYWLGDVDAANAFLAAPVEELLGGGMAENRDTNHFAGLSLSYSSAVDGEKDSAADESGITKEDIRQAVTAITEPIAVLNGMGKSGVGNIISSRLQNIGVDVVHTGNAKHFDYKYTNVIYPPNSSRKAIESAKQLALLTAVPKDLVRANKQATYVSLIVGQDIEGLKKRLDNNIKLILE